MNRASRVVIVLLVAVVGGGAFVWWRYLRPPPIIALPATPPAAPRPAPTAPAAVPSAPAIRYPVPDAPPPRTALPPLDGSDGYLENALNSLLGRKAVQSFLHLDAFARNFVATVNNLATENAAAQMWPVKQTGGRLDTEVRDGGLAISPKNADRYAAFVSFAQAIDTQRGVALYVRLYPLFQRAYQELGYPDKYFNDRVVEVIDNLLATPKVAEPIKIKRIAVDGAPSAAGALYMFEDPSLEASTAGQKVLLRMGRENAAKLMAKLADIRQRIVSSSVAQPSQAARRSP